MTIPDPPDHDEDSPIPPLCRPWWRALPPREREAALRETEEAIDKWLASRHKVIR